MREHAELTLVSGVARARASQNAQAQRKDERAALQNPNELQIT
jgi:hypothetical protein